MRVRMLIALAVFLAIAVPAQAKAGGFGGIVIAKQPQRAMLVLSGPNGVGLSVHAGTMRTGIGDRITVRGLRLGDGTIRASRLRVLSHTRRAVIRGVVVRDLRGATLVATGHSVITIHHGATRRVASVSDDGELRVGSLAEFQIRIDDENLLQQAGVTPLGQAANVQIEGSVVSVSPLVVSVEGLPITITVPPRMALPATLAAGARIELTVMTAAGNVFTLVSIDEVESANQVVPAPNQEVEVKGFVVGSTTTQLVVNSGNAMFTFAAAKGLTLPTLPVGTFVEARGVSLNGVLTLSRLKLEDTEGDAGSGGAGGGGQGGSGSGGGGDDGGGTHSGGGDHSGGH